MAVIDGKWLSKEGLTYFWSKIKSIFITMPQAYGDGTSIASDSDLDSYTTPGLYYATVTVARTLTNVPYTATGFRLIVEKNTLSGAAVFQTLTPTSRTELPSEYKRVYENDSWGPWHQFTKQTETNVIANLGAKNLFNINATPTVKHTSYNLTDDALTVTSSGNWASYDVPVNLPAGDYIFTTTISNFNKDSSAGATSVRMRIAPNTSGGTAISLVTITGNGVLTIPFTWPGGSLVVQYSPNYSTTTTFVTSFTASNSMIRRAEITDSTYVPYAPTNRELYEAKADKGTFQLAIAGAPLSASLYSYSCITTGDIAIVCIRIVLAAELGVSTSTLLFRLPAGYYPGITVAGMGYADTKLRTLWINLAGEIRIKVDEAVPAGSTIIASFCYSFRSSNWKTVTPNSAQSAASLMQAGIDPISALNLSRNDLNESLDTNFDLIDSIPEEEEGDIE